MQGAQLLYLFVLALSIVLMNHATKEMLMHNLGLKIKKFQHNFAMSLFLTLFESWLATQLYEAAVFIDFVGGITATVYIFLFSGMMGVKLDIYGSWWSRVLLAGWAVASVGLGFGAGVVSLINIIK